jgi:hypothetical protein
LGGVGSHGFGGQRHFTERTTSQDCAEVSGPDPPAVGAEARILGLNILARRAGETRKSSHTAGRCFTSQENLHTTAARRRDCSTMLNESY